MNSLNIKNKARKGAILATIGSILTFLGVIPFIGIIFFIIGLILESFGMKKLSDNAIKERNIFRNFFLGYVAIIFGNILIVIILNSSVIGETISISNKIFDDFTTSIKIGGIIFGIIVYLIFTTYGIIKIYKAINSIGVEYNVSLMQLVAKGYVAGIVFIPLLEIGYFILLITFIIKIIAYLKIDL